MKNIIILNNEKELINQIQVLLEEDRKSLETINGIIAETKKKTVTLSSYSNTFKYFKKNRNYILWLFYENNQSWLQIREIFETTVMKWFADSVKKWNRTAIFQALWNQKPEIITREMNLLLWNTISYHDYKEDFYHAFLTGIFMGAGEQIESNKEHGLGRPDLVIIDKANGKVAIFEVKYSQSMKQLNKDCDKALAQMKERKYAEDYKDRYKDIFCYGISFYKKECLVKMLES